VSKDLRAGGSVMSAVARLLDRDSATPAQRPDVTADRAHEAVIGAAVLVATAFRLRDEDALVAALRALVRAVQKLEDVDA
jgi:hypothetical protein